MSLSQNYVKKYYIYMSNFIVIDGADGSGKATQVSLLTERLRTEGYEVEAVDFPRYKQNHFGKLLRECLDGERGDFLQLDPRIASVIFAADRFESAKQIQQWLAEGKVVVADRYVSANMLHQGSKLHDEAARAEFLTWLDKMEHEVFDVPRPDLILYLDIQYQIRMELMNADETRAKLDTAEVDAEHQTATDEAAQALVASLNSWQTISCVAEGELRTREDIHEELYQEVRSIL